MAVAYAIDAEHQVVLVKAWGTVTGRELLDATDALHAMPAFRSAARELGDYRDVETVDLDSASVQKLAARSVFAGSVPRAVVVATDVGFGMARMYQMLREGPTGDALRVFRDMDEAIAWIGLDAHRPAVLERLAALRGD
ncbi:MAG: hypothetical protein KGO03_04915 [Gemmatimonadota bacterium]|nr:hypothetical protein [Gemmatimonadota bacterium]